MRQRTESVHTRLSVEVLESRRLLTTDPAGLLAAGYEPIEWQGQTVYAKPGQWIAKLNGVEGAGAQQVDDVNAALGKRRAAGLRAVRHLGTDGLVLLRSDRGRKLGDVKEALRAAAGVTLEEVEPDFALWTQATPNDTYYAGYQYGLHNTGQTGGTLDADIDAPEAWDLATGDGSVVVGVIDSGIDYGHQDLAKNMWRNPGEVAGNGVDDDRNGYTDDVYGWDFFNNDNNPMDDNGHGTHAAGTIAAAGNNAVGVTGVAWNAKLMALKFLGPDGSGSLSSALAAINYATSMRTNYGVNVRVTNNSWGGGGYASSLHDAITRSAQAGILFVAAAGNGGDDGIGDNNDTYPEYPAGYNVGNVISVAATDHNDRLAGFSNYGATSVDIAAPGVDIASTYPGNGYVYMSGTSMATPHVSGVAALAFGYSPGAGYQTVKNAILSGVDAVGSLAGRVATAGRLNAFKALRNMPAPLAAPAAPSGLAATATSATQVSLAWVDNAADEDGFRVYRSADGGQTFTAIATTGANVTTFVDTGLAASSGYQYRVRAFNAAGESIDSATALATTPALVVAPVAPGGLAAAAASTTQVNLTWSDNSANEAGFRIERKTGAAGAWAEVATVAAGVTAWQNTGLVASTTYAYRVRAYNTAGESPYSNEAAATTTAAAATPAPATTPALTHTRDVGGVRAAGSATYDPNSGLYSVKGSGSDIWSNSDEFRFAYTTMTGDGEIVARLQSLQASNVWAKAGVMVRETLSAGAKNAFMGVTRGNGVTFQRRSSTGGSTASAMVAGVTAPQWLKLVRSGSTLTGYRSADGITWTPAASTTIAMGATVYVGVAVTSHSDGALATATFGNVTVGGGTPAATSTGTTLRGEEVSRFSTTRIRRAEGRIVEAVLGTADERATL